MTWHNHRLWVSDSSGADLKGVDMEGSQMTGINLRVATLKNAKLKNCNLRGATLAGTDLEVRNMKGLLEGWRINGWSVLTTHICFFIFDLIYSAGTVSSFQSYGAIVVFADSIPELWPVWLRPTRSQPERLQCERSHLWRDADCIAHVSERQISLLINPPTHSTRAQPKPPALPRPITPRCSAMELPVPLLDARPWHSTPFFFLALNLLHCSTLHGSQPLVVPKTKISKVGTCVYSSVYLAILAVTFLIVYALHINIHFVTWQHFCK